jgi:F420-non-reducing hydrogenase small subunit
VADKVGPGFWPIVLDTTLSDVEAMEDGSIDVLFSTGRSATRRTSMLRVAPPQGQDLVAFGAAPRRGACTGLINTTDTESVTREVYSRGRLGQPSGVLPQTRTEVPEGTLELPALFDRVTPLSSVVQVDATVPGCPPNPERLNEVLDVLLSGKAIPNGAVVGASERALCETCPRVKKGLKVEGFRRPHLSTWDKEVCFMDQGLVCLGPVTRSGCGRLVSGQYALYRLLGDVPIGGRREAAMWAPSRPA